MKYRNIEVFAVAATLVLTGCDARSNAESALLAQPTADVNALDATAVIETPVVVETPIINTIQQQSETPSTSPLQNTLAPEAEITVQPRTVSPSHLTHCRSNESDPDGDGYGYENGESCLIETVNDSTPVQIQTLAAVIPEQVSSAENNVSIETDANDQHGSDEQNEIATCLNADSDPDGDGYGFENGHSCVVVAASEPVDVQSPVQTTPDIATPEVAQQEAPEAQPAQQSLAGCQSAASDPDGDGYGYENFATCVVSHESSSSFEPTDAIFTDEFPRNLHRVTDVILTAGQSNAFANGTRFEPDKYAEDRLDDRILVWTQDNGWKVANPLTQIWEHDHFPARPWDPVNSSNSPGYQIARAIVDADPSRVVAFIPTSTPGQSIHHWRYGAEAYNAIKRRVENALNDIPHKYQLDLIWWMQGESDANATDYYRRTLDQLINNWRGEPWYGADKYFIANETIRFDVNRIFRELRANSDPYTDYSPAEGLPGIHPGDAHFSSQSYRVIGNRVQQVYFDMLRGTGN